jgi:hypothetical protein
MNLYYLLIICVFCTMHETVILQKAEALKIPYFLGVFPSDRLPDTKGKPASFIMNHDRIDQPGSHWVALYVHPHPDNHFVEFFDSLAMKPPDELYFWKKRFSYGFKPVQNIFADTCGEHALYYLYLRLVLKLNRTATLDRIYRLKDADSYVKKFIHKV